MSSAPACVVAAPDGVGFALIQPVIYPAPVTPTDVLQHLRFPSANLFPNATVTEVTGRGPLAAEGALRYVRPDGTAGRAKLTYIGLNATSGTFYVAAASADQYEHVAPVLGRILRSHAEPAPQAERSTDYIRFKEPQYGAFTLYVPVGWQATAGVHRPGQGDRRLWFEATSPDGTYVVCDPGIPQSFCHMQGAKVGQVVPVGAGGHFVNLPPVAEASADCYLANLGPRRLPGFAPVARRARPDVVAVLQRILAAQRITIGRRGNVAVVETTLQRRQPGPPLTASLLTSCLFTGEYGIGTGFWESLNILCVSPSTASAQADAVRTHMYATLRIEPPLYAMAQQDEAQIYANAQVAGMAQANWFAGQQAAHFAQTQAGDALVSSYWNAQRSHESMLSGWERNQAVYDRLSQDRSDAMMDRQRLSDDAGGRTYDVSAGSNYYWLDGRTGFVVGTQTDQPPDYANAYTQLRKL